MNLLAGYLQFYLEGEVPVNHVTLNASNVYTYGCTRDNISGCTCNCLIDKNGKPYVMNTMAVLYICFNQCLSA